ncbi:MAG: plasmid stabilization system protein [Blastopirellula sp.]|nr:MAG: plasmid stabilization system protein [Blastopirellula sp.]
MYQLKITDLAQQDIETAYLWWCKHRSTVQAELWYMEIHGAISSLQENPGRCQLAPENNLISHKIRQLLTSIGKRPTHRIVYAISNNTVTILRVRHVAQDSLLADDLV